MGTIDLESGIEEFHTVGEFLFGVGDHDEVKTRPAVRSTYALNYKSSYGGIQTVVGTLRTHSKEFATIVTETDEDGLPATEYTVMGVGLANREKGEVVKKSGDSRRKVGEFDNAHAVSEESE